MSTSGPHTYAHTFEQTKKIHSYHTYKYMQKRRRGGAWWHTLLIPALKTERQVDLCEFSSSLVYLSRCGAVNQRENGGWGKGRGRGD